MPRCHPADADQGEEQQGEGAPQARLLVGDEGSADIPQKGRADDGGSTGGGQAQSALLGLVEPLQ